MVDADVVEAGDGEGELRSVVGQRGDVRKRGVVLVEVDFEAGFVAA